MRPFLVTRPEPDGQSTVDRLAALGLPAIAAPVMTRQALAFRLPAATGFAALAVTSANALRTLHDSGNLADLLALPVFTVGDRTASEARRLGFSKIVSAAGTMDDLVNAIALARLSGPVLYPAGKHRSGDLAHALAAHGLMVVTVPVYDMVAETGLDPAVAPMLSGEQTNGVLLYSVRTAELFCTLAAPLVTASQRKSLPMLCLSDSVAKQTMDHHFTRVLLADFPSEEAMMTLALTFSREQTEP